MGDCYPLIWQLQGLNVRWRGEKQVSYPLRYPDPTFDLDLTNELLPQNDAVTYNSTSLLFDRKPLQ